MYQPRTFVPAPFFLVARMVEKGAPMYRIKTVVLVSLRASRGSLTPLTRRLM